MVSYNSFDLGGLLTDEETAKFFEEMDSEEATSQEESEEASEEPETETESSPADAEESEKETQQEEVGVEEETEDDTVTPEDDGSSPIYASIAKALKEDGIIPDFDDEEIAKATTPELLAGLLERAIASKVDARVKRADEAIESGMSAESVSNFEQTLGYLNSINEDALKDESKEGEELRKDLIYNNFINHGYTKERALKELDKSFKAATDIEDAKDALEDLKQFYNYQYEQEKKAAQKKLDDYKAAQKKQADDFRKMILEDEIQFGDTKLDQKTRQKIYDAVNKPVYKDEETGRYLTEIQKFQKEKPLEFLKQLGMWYVLTDGGKNIEGFSKEQVRVAKNKGLRELASKINSSALNSDGSIRYTTGSKNVGNPLMSDDWKIG